MVIAAALLAFFLFVVGPTVFILSTLTESMGGYLTHLPAMSFRTGVFDGDANPWLSSWTIFYWAWWISWTPFVGMFIARISKGCTIRQFVKYVIIVPSERLVIVRLGRSPNWPPEADGVFDLVRDVVAATADKAKVAGAN